MEFRINNKTIDVFVKIGLYYLIAYLGFSFIRKVFGVDYLSDKLFTYGLGVMILLTIYVGYINKERKMFELKNFMSEKKSFVFNIFSILIIVAMIGFNIESIVMKSFVPETLVVTLLSLTIGFCEEGMFRFYIYEKFDCENNLEILKAFIISVVMFALLHMVNVSQGMRVIDAWVQSVAAINAGVIFSIIYLATKKFAIIALWHAYIDFNLFITKFGWFPITHKISVILDVLIRIIFAVCIILLVIKIYKNYRRKKVG